MLKTLTAAAIALTVAFAASPSQAGGVWNGIQINGFQINGTSKQATRLSGSMKVLGIELPTVTR